MANSFSRQAAENPIHVLIKALRQLFRLELSTMVALSALAGYLFAGGRWDNRALFVTAGVGLLAAGCSALNQWQEQDLDQTMERTKGRPLPTGQLSPSAALILVALTLAGGTLLLHGIADNQPLILGLVAVAWYNAAYTPLKRLTAFAAIPGALCGALPPLIGWTAAGAPLLTQKSLILAGTLFVWQIPHTWLLLCRYREDLQRCGLPNLFKAIPTSRLFKINSCWLLALLLCYLLFPLFGFIRHQGLVMIHLGGLAIIFILMVRAQWQIRQANGVQKAFHLTNISMALLLTVLILDRFLKF